MAAQKRKIILPLLGAGILTAGIAMGAGLSGQDTAEAAGRSKPAPAAASSLPASPSSFTAAAGNEAKTEAEFVRLQQIRFLNATTGWMVRSGDSDADRQPLRLLTTHDSGRSWSEQRLPGQYAAGLGLSSAKAGWALVYDGASEKSGTVSYSRARLLHTKDSGRTWQTQWSRAVSYTEEFPTKNNLVATGGTGAYALVGGRLLITHDGSAWSEAPLGYPEFEPQHVSFADAKNGWVSGTMPPFKGAVDAKDVVVLHTSDGGKTWKKQLAAGPTDEENSDSSGLRSAALDFPDAKTGFLLTDDPSMMAGDLYRTTDGGKKWTKVHAKLRSHRPLLTGMDFVDAQKGWIFASPGAGPVEGGLLMTRDGGKTFVNGTEAGYDVDFAQRFAGGKGYAAGSMADGQNYLTRTLDDGKTWEIIYPASSAGDADAKS
ncbi:WD40/YVTN/BNR-like repeat-containing protein [Saccharibacillus alkalitolerans]|uniref:Photosynthesis system II assembly factor Ycf48/Hcf136-like domain-containing protein n=1 Tax=Saccharibacillus alkalitolerans TaxID=2705290 RepID=A0ABX0F8V9_9BACL|nr:hypothetical protein [Saccharibacillus alkalitolerans]NGZ76350.1 hypothetical protein [Saccharibacillus alkalitolerans]